MWISGVWSMGYLSCIDFFQVFQVSMMSNYLLLTLYRP